MTIKLAFTSEKDLEKHPATFLMLSHFPDAEVSFGLGARSRVFHFTADLLQALEPAKFGNGFLRQLEELLELGKDVAIDVSEDQAAAIGMLPDRDGFQWVRTTVRRVDLGDGSVRYVVSYYSGTREVSGSGLETWENLENRVREFVALDWQAIAETLKTEESWSGVHHLPVETVRFIFDGQR
jgi:hypothetical protein